MAYLMNTYPEGNQPDRRLAKAFKFNRDDLIANQNGILSWRQRGLSDWLAYQILYRLHHVPILSRLFWRSGVPKKQPQQVQSLCGRIELKHYVIDQRLIRSSLFYEYYHLVFPGHNRTFRITREQLQALTENLNYRVYYQQFGEQCDILSIERIIGRCDGQKKEV